MSKASISFSWRIAVKLHERIKALADAKGISLASMLNIIVNENISKYE